MAECHPVGFQWVVEARRRGAKVIHVDPRFTRTSALADLHVPLRAGSDIAFLGGIVNYILEHGREFREYTVKYRRPYGTHWEELPLEHAMDMIVDRVVGTREENWQTENEQGDPVRRTLAIGNLGGATLDNEENYLIKKLCTALGIVQVENQARI